jgi:TonB family protein
MAFADAMTIQRNTFLLQREYIRYPVAIVLSVLVTAAVFIFMHKLISGTPKQVDTDNIITNINIYQPPPESPPPQNSPPPDAAPVRTAEPTMAPLSVNAPAPSPQLKAGGPPIPSFAASLDDISLASGSGDILGSGFGEGNASTWSPPGDNALAKKIAEADKKGAQGYREVVPFGTRQPNIPESAWKNKIDGWVLVTFAVNAKGIVENVRVLDSQPHGVFDENVIAAVSDWIYDPADVSGKKVKVQLTQRIDLHWKDYPNNNKQLK